MATVALDCNGNPAAAGTVTQYDASGNCVSVPPLQLDAGVLATGASTGITSGDISSSYVGPSLFSAEGSPTLGASQNMLLWIGIGAVALYALVSLAGGRR